MIFSTCDLSDMLSRRQPFCKPKICKLSVVPIIDEDVGRFQKNALLLIPGNADIEMLKVCSLDQDEDEEDSKKKPVLHPSTLTKVSGV